MGGVGGQRLILLRMRRLGLLCWPREDNQTTSSCGVCNPFASSVSDLIDGRRSRYGQQGGGGERGEDRELRIPRWRQTASEGDPQGRALLVERQSPEQAIVVQGKRERYVMTGCLPGLARYKSALSAKYQGQLQRIVCW